MNNENQDKSQGKLAKVLLVNYNMKRASYMIRGFAGVYLVYLMYQLFSEAKGSGSQLSLPMTLAGVLMIVAGIFFVIGAAYALLNGIYAENDPAELEQFQTEAGSQTEIAVEAETEAGSETEIAIEAETETDETAEQ